MIHRLQSFTFVTNAFFSILSLRKARGFMLSHTSAGRLKHLGPPLQNMMTELSNKKLRKSWALDGTRTLSVCVRPQLLDDLGSNSSSSWIRSEFSCVLWMMSAWRKSQSRSFAPAFTNGAIYAESTNGALAVASPFLPRCASMLAFRSMTWTSRGNLSLGTGNMVNIWSIYDQYMINMNIIWTSNISNLSIS